MFAVILTSVWRDAGYFMVIFLAGLNNIDKSYYEAASLDGAFASIYDERPIDPEDPHNAGVLTDALIATVDQLQWNRWWVMLVLMATYVVLGALMDELSMILLTVGPVFQLVTTLGFDPIWFGVIVVMAVTFGMICPPVGMNVFVINSIANVPLATVVRGIAPFAIVDMLRLLILALFPWLATWLPSRMV